MAASAAEQKRFEEAIERDSTATKRASAKTSPASIDVNGQQEQVQKYAAQLAAQETELATLARPAERARKKKTGAGGRTQPARSERWNSDGPGAHRLRQRGPCLRAAARERSAGTYPFRIVAIHTGAARHRLSPAGPALRRPGVRPRRPRQSKSFWTARAPRSRSKSRR